MNNLFVHLGNDTDTMGARSESVLSAGGSGAPLKLTRRKHIHRELMRFAELVHWMKDMDSKGFNQLQAVYRENLCKLYEKDIRDGINQAPGVSGGSFSVWTSGSTLRMTH